MKKFFLAILFLSSFYTSVFAAIAAGTQWDVRTTGSANNGGGFNTRNSTPGTDYSQQDNAEDYGTDLASVDGDASPCVVTSATHNFVDADEGNLIKITEAGDGFTVGYYEIVSTSANAATLDRACGSDGAKTGGDWYLGGASDHPNTIASVVVENNTVWIKSGTYVKQGANTFVLSYNVNGVSWIGYNTTHGDTPTGTDRPLFDGEGGIKNILVHGANVKSGTMANLVLHDATGACFYTATGYNFYIMFNVHINTCGTYGLHNNGGQSSAKLDYVEINNCSSTAAVFVNNPSCLFNYVYIHDNSGAGTSSTNGTGCDVQNSIFDSNTGTGFSMVSSSFVLNSIAYNNTGATADGFNVGIFKKVFNSVATDNGRYGFNQTGTGYPQTLFINNQTSGNATAGTNGIIVSTNTVTSDPLFTSEGGADFSLQTSSPLLGAGIDPDTFWDGFGGSLNSNIGIDQDDHVASTGGGAFSYGFSN